MIIPLNAPVLWTPLPEKLPFNAAQNQIPLLLVRPFTRVLYPSCAILLHLWHVISKVPVKH